VGQKTAHFQFTMSMQPIQLKWNDFHRHVFRIYENKDHNAVLCSFIKYSL